MTVILAAKYDTGVMYCYDTLCRDDDGSTRPAHKVMPVSRTPIVRSISGWVPDEIGDRFLLDEISREYDLIHDVESSIMRAVGKYIPVSDFFQETFQKYLLNSKTMLHPYSNKYIFSWESKKEMRLYFVDSFNNQHSYKDYAAIGVGAYDVVKEFLGNNHDSRMGTQDVIEMLEYAFDISLSENKRLVADGFSKNLLAGKAIAKHTSRGLKQLLFEKPNI